MKKTPVISAIERMKNARDGIAALDEDGKLDVVQLIREGDIPNAQLGDQIRANVTSEQTLSTTTLTNSTHLSADLEASSTYIFRLVLFIRCAGSAEGFKAALNGVAGVSSLKAQIKIYDPSGTLTTGRVEAFAATVGATLSAGDSYCEIDGSITTDATAGVFRLQWAQNAGAGVAATALEQDSYMRVEKV